VRHLKESPTVYGLTLAHLGDILAAVPVVKYALEEYHKEADYLVVTQNKFRPLLPFVPESKFRDLDNGYFTGKDWATRANFVRPINTAIETLLKISLSQAASLRLLGRILPPEKYYYIPLAPVDVGNFGLDFSNAVLLVVDSIDSKRLMPIQTLVELVQFLKSKEHTPVLVGSRQAANHNILEELGAVSLVGKTSLSELASILSQSKAVVGMDSGIINLAGTTSTPVVAGYTTWDPELRELPRPKGVHLKVVPECECRFCACRSNRSQAAMDNCEFGDLLCLKQLTGAKFIEQLEKVL
jgi:hypothetical protein